MAAGGRVGDRVILESERVGVPGREGEIIDVISDALDVHYRVRWADGHESVFFPSAGSVSILPGGQSEGQAGE